MKVLLDENLDHRLRTCLGGHEVSTVSYKGWSGLKNGKLLQAAQEDRFEVFITGDQTLYQEQNLTDSTLAIVAMSSMNGVLFETIFRRFSPQSITRNQEHFNR